MHETIFPIPTPRPPIPAPPPPRSLPAGSASLYSSGPAPVSASLCCRTPADPPALRAAAPSAASSSRVSRRDYGRRRTGRKPALIGTAGPRRSGRQPRPVALSRSGKAAAAAVVGRWRWRGARDGIKQREKLGPARSRGGSQKKRVFTSRLRLGRSPAAACEGAARARRAGRHPFEREKKWVCLFDRVCPTPYPGTARRRRRRRRRGVGCSAAAAAGSGVGGRAAAARLPRRREKRRPHRRAAATAK